MSDAIENATVGAIIWAPRIIGTFPWKNPEQRYFSVESDRELNRDKPECIGWAVALDGALWVVAGVERHMPSGPIRAGETIGLVVKPVTDLSDTG